MTLESENQPFNHNLGIILSGGGARGYAHLGVFKALEEMGVFPEAVAGVSAGSIVGTLYASGMDYAGMRKFIDSTSLVRVLFPDVAFSGLLSLSYLRDHLARFIPTNRIEELEKPLVLGLTNLNSGETEFWSEGPLRECVMASCAIPLVFQPIEIDGHLYVDGGLLMNFPVPALRSQCRNLIGVNLMPQIPVSNKKLTSGLSMTAIAIRSFYLSVINNTKPWRDQVEVLIEAPELYHYHIFQFGKWEEILEIGYRATMEKREEIEKLVFSF
ncbi:MAG: patatin-like phospholipase family protein [Saprospirales bacterium]|nr:patatin-like phospholipase family protein [Saprospirales bacterium]